MHSYPEGAQTLTLVLKKDDQTIYLYLCNTQRKSTAHTPSVMTEAAAFGMLTWVSVQCLPPDISVAD